MIKNEVILFQDETNISFLKEKGFSDEGIDAVKDYMFQRRFVKDIENSATPFDQTLEREGFKDKATGEPTILEYVPEEFCLSELNRLYPGWWCEGMKRSDKDEVIAFETVVVEGYLCVSYPLPSGRIAVEKRWAVADNDIKFKQGTKTPVDIGNNFKGARTEWFRIACKWYGIGLDIYHQQITPALRSQFEDLIRNWRKYASYWIEAAKTRATGKNFRDMLKSMPRQDQVQRMLNAIDAFPEADKEKLWKSFATHNNATTESRTKFDEFLNKLEQVAQQLKTK